MINYQYQILRYLPDQVSEEFVNLGVVVLDQEKRLLKAHFIDKAGKASSFFPDVNTRYLTSTLKFLQNEFNTLCNQLTKELPLTNVGTLDEMTRSILPKDDSALIFSQVKKGRDINLDAASYDLFERVVLRNMSDQDELELRNDREVWNKVYKAYFERHRISDKLQPHSVKTKNDVLQFDRAWKNGKWNCFETVTFKLTRTDSIKNKVYKWVGKLDELKTSKEPVTLYLLSVLPDNEDLRVFINRKLQNKTIDHSKVKLITEEDAEGLVSKFQKEIESKE